MRTSARSRAARPEGGLHDGAELFDAGGGVGGSYGDAVLAEGEEVASGVGVLDHQRVYGQRVLGVVGDEPVHGLVALVQLWGARAEQGQQGALLGAPQQVAGLLILLIAWRADLDGVFG
jgi:hypothetical protein